MGTTQWEEQDGEDSRVAPVVIRGGFFFFFFSLDDFSESLSCDHEVLLTVAIHVLSSPLCVTIANLTSQRGPKLN